MKGKRGSTRSTATPTGTNKKCPKCRRYSLRKDGHTPAGKQRWGCRRIRDTVSTLCYSTTNPDAPYRDQSSNAREPDENPRFARKLSGIKRFVITAAQNATPVHDGFFASLRNYCDYNDAELVVIPLRYKNATSQWSDSQENAEVWDVPLVPYLYNQRKKLNDNLVLVADVKTQPTAMTPLTRFDSLTGPESGIIGHTKIQMKTVAVPAGRYPKLLMTTGAVTVKNYTDTKAGKVGEFHHSLAAVVVEIIGKKFFVRHVIATKDGSFIDLTREYSPNGISTADPALALVFGDTHRAFIDKKVEKCTYEKGGMVDVLNPEHLVFHDLHDGYATNPHHRDNPFSAIAKRQASMHLVRDEVIEDVKWLTKVVGKRKGVVVSSNHDDFFARWIMDTDWRREPDNAEMYLETALEMVRSVTMTESGAERVDPFVYWVEKLKGKAPITCLGRSDSFTLGGVELSLHGDQGPNGSRGSRTNLRRIGVKTIVGHSHSPGIEEGCYQAGTSTPLRLEYNTGPSSWLQAHVVLYANGKRALLPIIDGQWCFDDSKK